MFLCFSQSIIRIYRVNFKRDNLVIGRSLRSLISFILVFLLIITNGCSAKNLINNSDKKDQLVLAVSSDPPTFNYAVNTTPYSIFGYLYRGLLKLNGITGEVEPALAESWEISPDKSQFIFTLREGLKWSDGVPLSADDVVFTYNQIYLNPKIPSVWKDFLKFGNQKKFPVIKKLDSTHIEFTLPEPFAPFLRYITRLAILPSHKLLSSVISLDESGNPQFISTWGTDTPPQEIVTNGPYKLVSYTPGERLIL
ncbi:MAG TPA: peptide ABC transporter substrate-binding protein, partial [Cyanothece sp. UBA12306]|nr:peptide ABC transporter substrate-binding protein [Cyanothece sp. UBA12306]